MTTEEYERLKAQARARAQNQLTLDLEAIERVFQIGGGLESTNHAVKELAPRARRSRHKGRTRKRGGRGWLLEAVRKFIAASNGKFTFPEARKALGEHTGKTIVRGSLKSAFKTLIGSGEMVVLRKGVGRTPGEYRKA